MKHLYIFLFFLFLSFNTNAQGYTLGIEHTSGTDFKVVATPDFTSAGNTDASDIGFTLVFPAGNNTINNVVNLLASTFWSVQKYNAAFLTGQGLGDGTKDVYLFNNPPGQSIYSHNAGDKLDLVAFTVNNAPSSGTMEFLLNTDPIAVGALGVLDSFYNSNIDATSTQDYFAGLTSGEESFMFATLSAPEIEIVSNTISLFPNPAKNVVNIKSSKNLTNIKVEIFDTLGKQILVNLSAENTIDISNLPSGLYLVSIMTDTIKTTKKLIVE